MKNLNMKNTKKDKKIPTANKLIREEDTDTIILETNKFGKYEYVSYEKTKELMIKFAKLHVEKALKEASMSTLLYNFTEEIINSYPLENIK